MTDPEPFPSHRHEPSAPTCLLIGGESLLIQCAVMLQAHGWNVLGVFTDAPAVRGWAQTQPVPVWPVSKLDAVTTDLPFDWLFSITHLHIVPEAVLTRARHGTVNFHDGPLPRYGGLNAPLWAVLAGEPQHGISWHRMDAAVDAGDVLVHQTFAIDDSDTALSINARCWEAALESFPRLLARLRTSLPNLTSRKPDPSTFHRRNDRPSGLGLLDPSQGCVDWQRLFRVADTGRYANSFLVPWLWTGLEALIVESAEALPWTETQQSLAIGTVVALGSDTLSVRVADGCMRLDGIRRADGSPCDVTQAFAHAGIAPGTLLPSVNSEWLASFDRAVRTAVARESAWVERLAAITPLPAPGVTTPYAPDVDRAPAYHTDTLATVPGTTTKRERLLAGIALFLGTQSRRDHGHVGFATRAMAVASRTVPLLAAQVPLEVVVPPTLPCGDAIDAQLQRLQAVLAGTYLQTVHARYPALADQAEACRQLVVVLCDDPGEDLPGSDSPTAQLCVTLHADASRVSWAAPHGGYTTDDLRRLHERLVSFMSVALTEPSRPVSLLPLMAPTERARLTEWGTGTSVAIDERESIATLFAAQAHRTPERVALVSGAESLSYATLLTRADAVARELVARGVRSDDRVALLCTRSTELVVGMLGILRAGGAYVPIDPDYPVDRVALMLEDCGARIIVTQRHLAALAPLRGSQEHATGNAPSLLLLDALATDGDGDAAPLPTVHGTQLAYVIYTSGSTGRPKGVMVEHRQIVNFFRGMDAAIGTEVGVWLAVTSMSFDISVLELLHTLTRGFTVVLGGTTDTTSSTTIPAPSAHSRSRSLPSLGFSLFYFSADEQEQARDKYRLLMEGARFADTHDFEAVWTPERHFHAFGGLYPNPSVTGAAIAAITSRVGIRAGSCVLPLHHPARVAEEWSVVDNLSGGRIGISFAAGWQPNDFVFRPENYADAKQTMFRDIEQVQRLWRGETLPYAGPKGEVEVRTLPRPVQPELPVWITTAGNPETFEQAGRFGGHLLTHLLGQSVEELAPKIAAYRAAWRAAGHAGEGRVTLMLHTCIGADDEQVRNMVRAPMTAYLRTSVGLMKQYAGVFPTLRRRPGSDGRDIDFASLTAEETDALLAFSFERYYGTSALFGSVETAAAMVERVRAIGVNELACLVDFGLDTDTVLAHLPHLDTLRMHCTTTRPAALSSAASAAARTDESSLSALIARHAVTHFQCTPSMARLLLAAPDTREALRRLEVMCVGGEALSPALAGELQAVLRGRLYNMYGPTETTIWSSVQPVPAGGPITLGRPIANTTLQVADPSTHALLPIGMPGELLIGGNGVTRGYLERPELTAERFVECTDISGMSSRLYRTGDLAQFTETGALQFLGRIDHQVKVRGYRIELGEIEAAIAGHASVQEVVVLAREEVVGDPRLVAYLTPRSGMTIAVDALRTQLKAALPDFMVPTQYVVLADMPRTPNLKIDRKALPAPAAVNTAGVNVAVVQPVAVHATAAAGGVAGVTADGELERLVAAVWCDVLRIPSVGSRDNFFDLGGHSLLVVQVHQRLTTTLQLSFPITDLFRFSTVQAIAGHLAAVQTAAGRASGTTVSPAPGTPPRDEIARRAELRRTAAQRHVRPRS